MIKYSIVITTYNHCEDLLKPCIEKIVANTDMSNFEVIVSANGCKDNTREYVESLGPQYKLVWSDEAIGYTKAANNGIKAATGEYIILMNDDVEIQPQIKNYWIDELEKPFINDPTTGITGVLELHDVFVDEPALILFTAMIPRRVFDVIGLYDEIYTPGSGEDIDLTLRARAAGFKTVVVAKWQYNPETHINVGDFPVWHIDNRTFKSDPAYKKVHFKRNGLHNCKKYNKYIKISLGEPRAGYLYVDPIDNESNLAMEFNNLAFDDNTVAEILIPHQFEKQDPYKAEAVLKEWYRALRPGGKLILEIRNIEALCDAFATATTLERYSIVNTIYEAKNRPVFGWWPDTLRDHLTSAGFAKINIETIGYHLRIEAVKLLPNHQELIDVEPLLYKEVFVENLYNIKDYEVRGKTIIDIGANIGYFSVFALELGAKEIIAVEAQPTIFKTGLARTIKNYPKNITPVNLAVYSTDNKLVDIENHHVGSYIGYKSNPPVPESVQTITLKTLSEQYPKATLLKIDCEGAEYDIILNSTPDTLRKFEIIYIEVHGSLNPNPEYHGVDKLEYYLAMSGFKKVFQEVSRVYLDQSEDVINEKWVRQ